MSVSPTVLLLCTSLSAQSSSVFNSLWLTAFILHGIRPFLNFMLPKYVFILLRISFHAVYDFEVISHFFYLFFSIKQAFDTENEFQYM